MIDHCRLTIDNYGIQLMNKSIHFNGQWSLVNCQFFLYGWPICIFKWLWKYAPLPGTLDYTGAN
ncbi:hypothetical protein BVX98_03770 [bacterium F11]|nr:hypothetical protein BVX98_03770 [bacterium F11]